MNSCIIIIVCIIVVLIIYCSVIYNSLVLKKNRVDEAFSTMDVFLKKRWDLIPSIVENIKKNTEYENSTLDEIEQLRRNSYNELSNKEKILINNKLNPKIDSLIVVSEAYPELKSSSNFKKLSEQLIKSEEDIANSRKYYNATVKKLNNEIKMFPSNIVAKLFGFKEEKMFEISSQENESRNVIC